MKKTIATIITLFVLVSCNNAPIAKPDNLIEEKVMTDILYDLALLDAIKSQNPYDSIKKDIKPKEFIYKKYNIDSLQFVKSNQYYISQIEEYKKMYEAISERLEDEKASNDLLQKKSGTAAPSNNSTVDTPQLK
jgi:CDP-diacylglycerol pyrophosphatase